MWPQQTSKQAAALRKLGPWWLREGAALRSPFADSKAFSSDERAVLVEAAELGDLYAVAMLARIAAWDVKLCLKDDYGDPELNANMALLGAALDALAGP